MKKALLVFGSTNQNGNTKFLVDKFKENFNGEVETIDANKIVPCVDCGACQKKLGCVIKDDFTKLYSTNYDVLVLAFPIFYSNAPAPIWNVISRLNFMFNNKHKLNSKVDISQKQAGIILLAGGNACEKLMGESNEDLPIKQAKYICSKLNAEISEHNIVKVLNTDIVDIQTNIDAQNLVFNLAKNLSKTKTMHRA